MSHALGESSYDRASDDIEGLIRTRCGHGYRVASGSVWIVVYPDGATLPEHGWKLHLSARVGNFGPLLETVLPILVTERCVFKVAKSSAVLQGLNDGLLHPASVGKAVTVYPDPSRVRDLGAILARATRGQQGPRVLSDRRLLDDAPVYYRYGAFAARPRAASLQGGVNHALMGPRGQRFDADATLRYRQPDWVNDPFANESSSTAGASLAVLGDHFRVLVGIREAPQGNVYRGIDERDGSKVIIKQARPFVAERGDNDARLRLRNERRILQVLAGVDGVPALIDHFKQDLDEFLVIRDCGDVSLSDSVRAAGVFRAAGAHGGRDLDRLATQLAHILGSIHARHVVMRDLTPSNVVIAGEAVSVVDFGLSAFDGLHLPGGTPGYQSARQANDAQPEPLDDLYGLGMTLLYAATGLNPVPPSDDLDRPRVRALQALAYTFGEQPDGVPGAIAGLISGDAEQATSAFRRLRRGQPSTSPSPQATLPTTPEVTGELVEAMVDSLRADLMRQVERLLRIEFDSLNPHDLNMHGGIAGIGLELLHHLQNPRVAEHVADLVRYAHHACGVIELPQGLFDGTTGIALFIAEAASRGISPTGVPPALPVVPPDWMPSGDDLTGGAAGVGLGYIHMNSLQRKPSYESVILRCARHLARTPATRWATSSFDPALPGVNPKAGGAHGLAGITEFLLALARHTNQEAHLDAAIDHVSELSRWIPELVLAAQQPSSSTLSASWCQGLAGAGRALLRARLVLDDPSLDPTIRVTADACLPLLARMSALGQCCGATGIGSFLIDLAHHTMQDYYRHALEVANHLLLRNAGPDAHPVFVEPTEDSEGASWARGTAGILGFFRRLGDSGQPNTLPVLDLLAPSNAGHEVPSDSLDENGACQETRRTSDRRQG